MRGTPAWSMTPDEQRHALLELRKQQARLRELELRVLEAADRNDIGAPSGATSTPAWLAHETKTTRAARFADLHLAHALDEEFDATRRALAAGDIDVEKAAIIVKAVRELTDEYDDLPPGTQTAAEAHMVDLAKEFDAAMLRKLGKRLFEVVCPNAADEAEGRKLAAEEERARRLTYLTTHDNGDGTVDGRFRLPSLHAALLKKALQALTAPRRIGEGRFDPETGKKLPASTLLGQGFMDLLENHLNLDTLPSRNGSPFRLVVTIPLEYLCSGLGIATTDVGVRISAGEVRRLTCKAGILPLVLDGESVPLDLGREKRLFDKNQTIAMDHLFGGCAATNCDRPPAWVEYHHKKPWAKGGDTDVGNGIPLCPPHHHMADRPERWDMHTLPDGRVRFHRRT
ncbi:MAG TPA: DUF222 domain-containing protein [Nocardioidaceae bacterium]|nr:DUF222 domain-containing protein [Nocardioidaceae bacterium]